MLIVLDYDGTYTLDEEFWKSFYFRTTALGHKVICATMRYESEPIADMPCKVIYTGRKAKEQFLLDLGIKPDIWIDDNPAWLYQDSI